MHIRRVMWLDLEERIQKVFDSAKETLETMNSPVSFYLSKIPVNGGVVSDRPAPSRVVLTNGIYIHASAIHYQLTKTDGEKAPEHVFDSGAQLWLSQSPSGGVDVFMSPYISQLHHVKEKELLVASYDEPSQLREAEIKKHLVVFARYLVETNMANQPTLKGYLWRVWLMAGDRRNRSELIKFTLKPFSRLLIPVLGLILGVTGPPGTGK